MARAFDYAAGRAAIAENECERLREDLRQRDNLIELFREQIADLDRRVSAIERLG